MWGLNNLASKAAEALNTAKKGINDIKKETNSEKAQEKSTENSMNLIKKQCLKYKADLEKQQEKIEEYKKIIGEMQKKGEGLVNFRIVIGKDEENDAESFEKIQELNELLEKKEEEVGRVKQLAKENMESFKQELEDHAGIVEEFVKNKKKLEEMNESCQENLLKYKMRVQRNVKECYGTLKESFDSVGLNIPQINPENLGTEDLQEFIYTQSRYIEDSMTAINGITGTFNKKVRSLEELKKVLSEILNDSSAKLSEFGEKLKKSEGVTQKTLLEKENLHKILGKKDERIVQLTELTQKLTEEAQLFETTKSDCLKLTQKVKNLTETKENSEKMLEDLKGKLKKTTEYIKNIEETNTNLKIRVKNVNNTINDKENSIKSLTDQVSALKESNIDFQSALNDYKSTSEKNIREVNEMYLKQISSLQDTSAKQISDLKSQLSKSLNEAKDSGLAKIQVNTYQKAVENLQEIVKHLESQSSNQTQKFERLSLQNENSQKLLKKSKEKAKLLKKLNQDLQGELSKIQENFQLEKEILINKAKENEMLRYEAETLLARIEVQIQASDSMIDKRLISTFLINYLNEKNNAKIKLQMLRALAEMLGLNQEQRIQIGLVQEQGIFSHLASYITRS